MTMKHASNGTYGPGGPIYEAMIAERDGLRAEIERLRADLESGMERFYSQMAELDNAKAEIKQLKADRTALVEYGWKLERENDGLRAALPRHRGIPVCD